MREIVTQRLVLRLLQTEDVPAFSTYRRSPATSPGTPPTRLFERHDIHRVCAQADDRKVPVQRLLERLGFRCEARLLEPDWFKGEWTTLRTYAVLRREWTAAP
jgi:hypothetical protein